MAFFGLSDIRFNDIEPRKFGADGLAALEKTDFEKTTLRYPLTVGSADKGHYMVFFVREQKNTSFKANDRGGQSWDAQQEIAIQRQLSEGRSAGGGGSAVKTNASFADVVNNKLSTFLNQGTNAVKQKFGSGGRLGKISGAVEGFVAGPPQPTREEKVDTAIERSVKSIIDKSPFGFMNTTRLTSDAIALYMPDTINFDSEQNYSELRPGEEILGQALAAAPELLSIMKSPGENKAQALVNAAKKSGLAQKFGENALAALGSPSVARLGLFAGTGRVTNPMLELLYSSPALRTFQFEFFFYPRSEREAYEVQKIIERFRFHQAPELERYPNSKTQSGLLIPPSEFDIKFFYAGKQNPNIPPIATCVLQSVQVNFAPRGWTAYESIGDNDPALGRTGMPVAIQMSLGFRETTYITKEDFNIGSPSVAGKGVSNYDWSN
jgi:hypothetical protein